MWWRFLSRGFKPRISRPENLSKKKYFLRWNMLLSFIKMPKYRLAFDEKPRRSLMTDVHGIQRSVKVRRHKLCGFTAPWRVNSRKKKIYGFTVEIVSNIIIIIIILLTLFFATYVINFNTKRCNKMKVIL